MANFGFERRFHDIKYFEVEFLDFMILIIYFPDSLNPLWTWGHHYKHFGKNIHLM